MPVVMVYAVHYDIIKATPWMFALSENPLVTGIHLRDD